MKLASLTIPCVQLCTTSYEAFLKQSIYIEALLTPISVRIYWQCKSAEAGDT